MSVPRPGRLLRIHLCKGDMAGGRPAHEAIVAKCRELGIAGATVFRGLEGYGESAEMHRPGLLHSDQPVVVVVVDTADRINSLLAELESVITSGTMAMSDVEMIRVNRSGSPRERTGEQRTTL